MSKPKQSDAEREAVHDERQPTIEEDGYTTYSYELEEAYERYLADEEGSEEKFFKLLDARRRRISEESR